MPRFQEGDKVMVMCHPKPHYRGLEGTISRAYDALAPNTRAVTESGALPEPGVQPKYDVKIEGLPDLLTDLYEGWLKAR